MFTLAGFKALPWKLIGLAALGLFIAGLMLALKIERTQNDKLKAQIEKCAEARKADRAAYEKAQAEAALKNKQRVQRIARQQQEISDETARNLNTRLERLRRELRQKAPAAPGASQGPGAGPDGKAPAGADGQAQVCIPSGQFLLGAEYEEKLDQWITWAERQGQVER